MDGFSLFRRAKKIYYVKYLEDGTWKKRSLKTTKRSEAIRKVENLTAVLRPSLQRITFGSFVQKFFDHAQQQLSPAGLRRYSQAIARFRDHLQNDDRALESISLRECDEYVSLRLQSVRPTTVNSEVRHLKAFLNRAVRWEYLARNPFEKVRLQKIPETPPTFLSKDEFRVLYSSIEEPWLKLAVLLSCTLGLRSGEVIAQHWRDIDTSGGIVHVRNTVSFTTKSKKNRVIPIPKDVISVLDGARAKATSEFVLHDPQRRIDSYLISHRFKHYVRKLGLNPRLHFHSCRHTAATWWTGAGIPLNVTQRWLGHSSISVVMIYAHAQPQMYEEYASRIVLPSLN